MRIKTAAILPFLAAGFSLLPAGRVTAQPLTALHDFTSLPTNDVNADGAYPYAGLALSGNTLYGVTYEGGGFGDGTVYAVNTDGTGFATLHDFSGAGGS
jgi:uncharacterized repeat protein (TIGR03803 family)